jgi:hypothetical protein
MIHDAFADCHYDDCHYVECHYAECCGIKKTTLRYGYRLPRRQPSQATATPVRQVGMGYQSRLLAFFWYSA